jgi:hypothetical protein
MAVETDPQARAIMETRRRKSSSTSAWISSSCSARRTTGARS